MSSSLVTGVRKSTATPAGDHHIIAVQIDNIQVITVAKVYAWMRRGDDFYTWSPSTGKRAAVEPWRCCGIDTLRSNADAVTDNNLDDLPAC
jgi:hypothetical protein